MVNVFSKKADAVTPVSADFELIRVSLSVKESNGDVLIEDFYAVDEEITLIASAFAPASVSEVLITV